MHIFMPSFGSRGVFFFFLVVSHTVYLFYSTYVLELIYYCETHRLVHLYVFVKLCSVIWNDVSVVSCRQSNCSYNVESL